jgi:hypothetical protein
MRSRRFRAMLFALVVSVGLGLSPVPGAARRPSGLVVRGAVVSGGAGLAGYSVGLYAAFSDGAPRWVRLGSDTSDAAGAFDITYSLPRNRRDDEPLLFVEATRGRATLASAIGGGPHPVAARVVVNERTTVATGNAFAQFVDGRRIEGNTYGMSNAVRMAGNLADPQTGAVGSVLATTPNGPETSTLATFNSLANAVASCIAADRNCTQLFRAATPPGGGPPPTTVLQAVANIVKYPSYPRARRGPWDRHQLPGDPVFALAQIAPVYGPALSEAPTNWLLFLKFTGGAYKEQDRTNLMNGPGNFAIDGKGFLWVNDNAVPQPPDQPACAGRRLLKFYPWGENVPGSPYFGGGLSGAGYGITLDPRGGVWVSNFGFQDPPCARDPRRAAPHNSVSLFRADGTAVSGIGGYTNGDISWPQGTVSDRHGNIWIANCGNDSVTKIPRGDHNRAFNIPLGPARREPHIKPFGAAVDTDGNVWVTGNRSNTVSVLSPDGELIATLPGTYQGKTVLSHPVGNAADSEGNIWVANSDWLDSPCPTRLQLGTAENPSITLHQKDTRTPYPGSPFTGGGLTLPWGIAVDGNNTVWVFNFGAVPVNQDTDLPTGISHFCGTTTSGCPKGMKVGDPISPSTGYTSDALERITGGQIDPSGNVWLTNNWKRDANPVLNPFGNAIVVAIGAAGPLNTPLIGPPVPF